MANFRNIYNIFANTFISQLYHISKKLKNQFKFIIREPVDALDSLCLEHDNCYTETYGNKKVFLFFEKNTNFEGNCVYRWCMYWVWYSWKEAGKRDHEGYNASFF